ncbi:MaoC family dehydratase [Jatrophihabitans fulvus]
MADKMVMGSIEDIESQLGVEVGPTDWITIEQDRIDRFAEATGDHQWIHVDAERAKDGPFGRTIAHGFLTLSLLPFFLAQLRETANLRMGVNYGLNKVRFPAPVPVGSRLRGRSTITEVNRLGDDAVQFTTTAVLDIEGSEKPAVVAEFVVRYFFEPTS